MAEHSPLPWRVEYDYRSHYEGSPLCDESCGKGQTPMLVKPSDSHAGLWSGRAVHVMEIGDLVDDIIAANGDHVVCMGHDYDEYGSVSRVDAEFIVRACNSHADLVAVLKEVVSYYGNTQGQLWLDAKAAIAKAEAQ